MTFILEKISQEDKEKYGFGLSPDRWVIDRERNMFLINVGGFGMGIGANYELHLNNDLVKISAEHSLDNEKTFDTTFTIIKIDIPGSLKSRSEEIKSAIGESLKKYGYFGNPNKVGMIEVNSLDDSKIFYINSN